MKIEKIAELCHEINRTYCSFIGDNSQTSWSDAPDWQRISAINGVRGSIENNTTPEDFHKLWMKEKLENGWSYGSIKNPIEKIHPCLVGYDQLSDEQKVKDSLFISVVSIFK